MFDINEFWGERKALQEAFKIDYDDATDMITNIYKRISVIDGLKHKNISMFVKIFVGKKIQNRKLTIKDMEQYFLDFQKQEDEFDALVEENSWTLIEIKGENE